MIKLLLSKNKHFDSFFRKTKKAPYTSEPAIRKNILPSLISGEIRLEGKRSQTFIFLPNCSICWRLVTVASGRSIHLPTNRAVRHRVVPTESRFEGGRWSANTFRLVKFYFSCDFVFYFLCRLLGSDWNFRYRSKN